MAYRWMDGMLEMCGSSPGGILKGFPHASEWYWPR